MTAKKIKRRFKTISFKYLWPLLPTMVIIALVVFLSRSQFFTIKKITCRLDNHPCPLEFEPILVNLHQQNLLKLNRPQLVDAFKNHDFTLSDIEIKKTLPHSLFISMRRRSPIAQIVPVIDLQFQGLSSTDSATISGQLKNQFFHLDKTGEIFSETGQPNPTLASILVSEDFNLQLGSTDQTKTLANLVNALAAYYVNFDSLSLIKPDLLILKTTLGPYAVIDLNQPANSQVASLQYILTGLKIGERIPTKIDLRFDKPVLAY